MRLLRRPLERPFGMLTHDTVAAAYGTCPGQRVFFEYAHGSSGVRPGTVGFAIVARMRAAAA
jgi:hypothetical protein